MERVLNMHMSKTVPLRFKRRLRPTYIKAWRKYRGLTLEQTADRMGSLLGGFTHASVSRIENGKQSYSQPILEALAEVLGTDAASLLMRDPNDPHGIWSIWDHATPSERKLIVDLAKSVVKHSQ